MSPVSAAIWFIEIQFVGAFGPPMVGWEFIGAGPGRAMTASDGNGNVGGLENG